MLQLRREISPRLLRGLQLATQGRQLGRGVLACGGDSGRGGGCGAPCLLVQQLRLQRAHLAEQRHRGRAAGDGRSCLRLHLL